MNTITEVQHVPGDTRLIASDTDPWLRDSAGNDVDLTPYADDMPYGVFAPVNSDYGIETDDEAGVFDSDFDAAHSLAAHLTTITGDTYTVWFETGDHEEEA